MGSESGREAEAIAARYLEARGLKIIERNWHNRWCEVDIIARSGTEYRIVEVKYRRTMAFGGAAEYVTADKISRLRRAASAWIQIHDSKAPYQIDVVTVEGSLTAPAVQLIENAIYD